MISYKNRQKAISELASQNFDLTIIGGGITGAGICLDAVSKGLKVLLLDKGDYASGTSGKSTKLIHGGLRYLKQLEFKLVADVGRERAIVHAIAPYLVHPEKMYLPFKPGGTLGWHSTNFALIVYDFLAKVSKDDKKQMYNTAQAKEKEPLLNNAEINGAGYYAEYRTDDTRLTIELLKTATDKGATILNYAKVDSFLMKEGKINGLSFTDVLTDNQHTVKSKYVVSAAGPWVDKIRSTFEEVKGKKLVLTKGVHLVVPFEKLPVKTSTYFDAIDGRMIFAIPRLGVTYIGTTDTFYDKDIDAVYANAEDAKYLCDCVNNMFPEINITPNDAISSWAGLRPLIYEEGKDPSELSRKDEVFISDNGLISIAGGKLTGYRLMAEKIIALLDKDIDFPNNSTTKNIALIGGNFKDYKDVLQYMDKLSSQLSFCKNPKLEAEYLVSNYGRNSDKILSGISGIKSEPELLKSEVSYCVKQEAITSSLDFWVRRSGRMYFRIETVHEYKSLVNELLSEIFNWENEKKSLDLEAVNKEITKLLSFQN